jgi:hypothetical protein
VEDIPLRKRTVSIDESPEVSDQKIEMATAKERTQYHRRKMPATAFAPAV